MPTHDETTATASSTAPAQEYAGTTPVMFRTKKPQPTTRNALMVDLETMDTGHNAAILTIGACMFDPLGADTEESLRETSFYRVISLKDNTNNGRSIGADTVMWWLGQSQEAQTALLEASQDSLRGALSAFYNWIATWAPKPTNVWAKDPDFDVSILQDAFNSLNILWPFAFYEARSVRTCIEDAYPCGEPPRIGVGTAHNALDDAIRQALQIQDAKRRIHSALDALEGYTRP